MGEDIENLHVYEIIPKENEVGFRLLRVLLTRDLFTPHLRLKLLDVPFAYAQFGGPVIRELALPMTTLVNGLLKSFMSGPPLGKGYTGRGEQVAG